MRNLKKVLSLVLCMAMMLSIMVVGAGAAFKDQEKIVNEEAVDMCSALNIINGYTDGSFKPEGTITRAEACKMICVALNGGKEPVLPTKATPTFSDVRGTSAKWAEGYIEYCYSEGIVAGIGGGKFNPAGNVTGSQFAKMLLIALGYDQNEEKFTGSAWEVNVNVKATQKDLYDELETLDVSAALTRDAAAQMVWNALQAYVVEYEYKLTTVDGTLTSQMVAKDKLVGNPAHNITLLGEKYGAVEFKAVLTGYTSKQAAKFDPIKYADGADASSIKFNDYTVDDSDLIGRDVTILAKEDRNGNYTIYGLFEDSDFTYIETIAGKVTDYKIVNSKTDKDTVKIDGTKYDVAAKAAEGATADDSDVQAMSATKSALPVIVKINDEDEVVSVTGKYDTFDVKKVTFVGSKSITAGASYDIEDVEAYDGIKKDDWVVIHENKYTGNTVMTKADVVTGEVTKINGDDVTIDGTVYTKTSTLDKDQAALLTLSTNVKVVVVNGYIYNVEKVSGIASLDEVVYINGMKTNDDYGKTSITAKATFADGTAKEIKVVKVNNADGYAAIVSALTENSKINANKLNGLYKFDVDDGDYTLEPLTVGAASNDDFEVSAGITENSTQAGDNKIAGMRVNDDAVVFVIDKDGDVVMKDGKTVKAWKDTTVADSYAYGNKTNGVAYADVAVVVMGSTQKIPGASNDAVYGYVLSYDGSTKNEDKDTVYTYTLWTKDGKLEVTTDTVGTVAKSSAAEGTFVKYEDGDLAALNGDIAKLTGIDDDVVFFNDMSQEYNITDDTQIIYINYAAGEGVEGGSLVVAEDVDGLAGVENNVYVKHDDSDKDNSDGIDLLYIFVDVNNDIENKLGN